jgi:hypothetical protein
LWKGISRRMGIAHGLQARRFELKYMVDQRRAESIRTFIRSYLEPDAFFRPEQKYGYSVRSLYLDTPSLTLKRATEEGLKNRFKLRIRFYDDDPASPAFLEIKRRENDVIRKERAAVNRSGVQRILEGGRPEHSQLLRADAESIAAMENFCGLCQRIGAHGSLFVVYFREAYVPPDSDNLRVTFDRQVESHRYHPGRVLEMPPEGRQTDISGVVLEIKFTDRFPSWARDMVEMFGLSRQSVPKYVECVKVESRNGRPFTLPRGVW